MIDPSTVLIQGDISWEQHGGDPSPGQADCI